MCTPLLRILLFLSVAECTIFHEYKSSLIRLVDYFNNRVTAFEYQKMTFEALMDRASLYVLAIGTIAVIVTFAGLKMERCSLCIFVAIFVYSQDEVIKQFIQENYPQFVESLPETLRQLVESESESKLSWAVFLIILAVLLLFLLVYKLLKIGSMIILGYYVWGWILENFEVDPVWPEVVGVLGIAIAVILLYKVLESVYDTAFAAVFASYGSLFILSILFFIFVRNNTYGIFIDNLSRTTGIDDMPLLGKTAFLWLGLAFVGFAVQVIYFK